MADTDVPYTDPDTYGGPDDFYRQRDRLVGGTDNQYSRGADFGMWHAALGDAAAPGPANTIDVRADDDNRFSGVLSQSDLAS